jgi:hypothetical protein
MTDPVEPTEEASEPVEPDVIGTILNTVAELSPESMVQSFITVIEWVEPDGSYAISTIGTPMSPWLQHGLLTFARSQADAGYGYDTTQADYDEAEEEPI